MQNAKNKKDVVITTPKTLSALAKTTTAMATDVVDFDFEIEIEVLTKWIHEFPNLKLRIFSKFSTNQIVLDEKNIK